IVQVKKPSRLCVPVNKNNEEPGAETHADHLLCYQVKQTSFPRFVTVSPLFVNDQFGPETLDARKPKELCVPALRNPVAPTVTPTPTVTATATPGGATFTATPTVTPSVD